MLNLVVENTDYPMLRTVEFAAIEIGNRFTTDRWIWEKVDRDNAKALDELMGRSSELTGAVFHFRPWSKVQLIEPV
jgi:hypothetical protein